jgi:hypothetical protein
MAALHRELERRDCGLDTPNTATCPPFATFMRFLRFVRFVRFVRACVRARARACVRAHVCVRASLSCNSALQWLYARQYTTGVLITILVQLLCYVLGSTPLACRSPCVSPRSNITVCFEPKNHRLFIQFVSLNSNLQPSGRHRAFSCSFLCVLFLCSFFTTRPSTVVRPSPHSEEVCTTNYPPNELIVGSCGHCWCCAACNLGSQRCRVAPAGWGAYSYSRLFAH